MSRFYLSPSVNRAIDEIYTYTAARWGDAQAERYLDGLFSRFAEIAERRWQWRAIPEPLGIEGWTAVYGRLRIYWKLLSDGRIGFFAVLHERMHQAARLAEIADNDAL